MSTPSTPDWKSPPSLVNGDAPTDLASNCPVADYADVAEGDLSRGGADWSVERPVDNDNNGANYASIMGSVGGGGEQGRENAAAAAAAAAAVGGGWGEDHSGRACAYAAAGGGGVVGVAVGRGGPNSGNSAHVAANDGDGSTHSLPGRVEDETSAGTPRSTKANSDRGEYIMYVCVYVCMYVCVEDETSAGTPRSTKANNNRGE
jgi:hypothetical protein